jgi:BirA family biotin operon repressor/biotin-[acetyl-CoA-carboxylase] ligase
MTARDVWRLDHRFVGRSVLIYDRLDSTNNRAAELAADPANDGVVVLADEQTAGRGQQGRTWVSTPGSAVLLSALLFPPVELRRPALLTAWAAVAVGDAIREIAGLPTTIKWPNDVFLAGRKVCGILIESRPTAEGRVAVVVGVGLNVNQSADAFAAAGLPDATSLAVAAGRSFVVADVARRLIRQLDEGFSRLVDGDAQTLEEAWQERIGLLGRRVVAERHDGLYRGRLLVMSWAGITFELDTGERREFLPETVRHLREMPKAE